MNWMFYAMAILAGVALPIQVRLNRQVKEVFGSPLQGTFVSFAIGTVAALLACLVARYTWPSSGKITGAPSWIWLGGVLGVYLIFTTIFVSPKMGAALTLALVVSGQLVTSTVLDHMGALGFPKHPLNLVRLSGVTLVCIGVTVLAVGERRSSRQEKGGKETPHNFPSGTHPDETINVHGDR
jgi:transporter family-2 protein